MKKLTYFALCYKKDATGFYSCIVPDVEAAGAQGRDMGELSSEASAAVRFCLEENYSGKPAPVASTVEMVAGLRDPEMPAPDFVMPVVVYLPEKQVTTCIAGSDADLQRIKDAAKRFGTTRSALMVKASLDYIERLERGDME